MGVSAAATEIQSEGVGEFVQGLRLPTAAESPVRRLLADMFPLPARVPDLSRHPEGMCFFLSTKILHDHTQFLLIYSGA